jgi:hypothetical protein
VRLLTDRSDLDAIGLDDWRIEVVDKTLEMVIAEIHTIYAFFLQDKADFAHE